ncbi:hypothetical protein FQN49_000178 [Arthroderma sp. PD_2]|nr:hypothetical protein FQN49_000178 [Arthroderma sp. PD_2]
MFIFQFVGCVLIAVSVASQPLGENELCKSTIPGSGVEDKDQVHEDNSRSLHTTVGPYPSQLSYKSFPGRDVHFLGCTDDATENVIRTQLPKRSDKRRKIITLATGGRNALFSRILKACIFGPDSRLGEKCDILLETCADVIENELYDRIYAVYEAISMQSNKTGLSPVILHTLYDNFVNADSNSCDEKSMGFFLSINTELTKDVRSKLFSLTEGVNQHISRAAAEWEWKTSGSFLRKPEFCPPRNQQIPENLPDPNPVVVVSPNNRSDDHPFCEGGIETFNDESVWFFSIFGDGASEGCFSAADIDALDFNTSNSYGVDLSTLDYSHVNTKTCAEDPRVQNTVGGSIECDLARYFEYASASFQNLRYDDSAIEWRPQDIAAGSGDSHHELVFAGSMLMVEQNTFKSTQMLDVLDDEDEICDLNLEQGKSS